MYTLECKIWKNKCLGFNSLRHQLVITCLFHYTFLICFQTRKTPLSRQLNFSSNETLTADSRDPEGSSENLSDDATECEPLVDNSSDLELFSEDLENEATVVGTCSGDYNWECSSVGSDLETVSSVTGGSDNALRSVTGQAGETQLTVMSQKNDIMTSTGITGGLDTVVSQSGDNSTTANQVSACLQELCSLEIPAETYDTGDENVESREGIEMFTGKYDCSEDRANKSESIAENESENEIYFDHGLCDGKTRCVRRKQFISSVKTESTVATVEIDTALDDSLNGTSSDVVRNFQTSNSGGIDEFIELSSQEVQTESQITRQTCLSAGINTQNGCVINRNDVAVKLSSSDTKQLTQTSLNPKSQSSKNKSNNPKCFKQQDIGVYFGLKALQSPKTKMTKTKTNQSSKRTVNDVLKGKPYVSNKRGIKSSAKNSFDNSSSEQDVSSGNNDEAQVSTRYRRCPFYKKIPGKIEIYSL